MKSSASADLPANPEVERFVLGSICLNGSLMDSLRTTLEADDFSLESHRRIWRAICRLYDLGSGIDRITVFTELSKAHESESIGGLSYLASLDDGLPRFPQLDSYIAILKDKTILRRLLVFASNVTQRCLSGTESGAEIRESSQVAIADLGATSSAAKPTSTRELVDTFGIDALLNPHKQDGLRFPWGALQRRVSGMHAGQMIVLAALTGKGKTSMALQIATHATRQAKSVIVWTLEMHPTALFRRLVNQMARIDASAARQGKLVPAERDRAKAAVAWVYDHPIWFDTHSRSPAGFIGSVRQAQAKSDVGLAVVDYLQLVRCAGHAESRAREVGENSRSLKLAAMELEMPFLVLSQFRRPTATTTDVTIHALKDSGDIENDADVILLLNSPDKAEGRTQIPVLLNIGKQREGPAGMDVPLTFDGPSQSFFSPEDSYA